MDKYQSDVLDRAKKIKLLLSDVDGVWTDGGIIYDNNRLEYKKFNVKDGMGVKLLQQYDIKTAVITGRDSEVVRNRCKEIGIDFHFHGVEDKLETLRIFLDEIGLEMVQCAYIGDDLPDLAILNKVGLSAAPADAVEQLKNRVNFVTSTKGGEGVFREVSDLILEAKGHMMDIIHKYS